MDRLLEMGECLDRTMRDATGRLFLGRKAGRLFRWRLLRRRIHEHNMYLLMCLVFIDLIGALVMFSFRFSAYTPIHICMCIDIYIYM